MPQIISDCIQLCDVKLHLEKSMCMCSTRLITSLNWMLVTSKDKYLRVNSSAFMIILTRSW